MDSITFSSGVLTIEGLLTRGPGEGNVVITHPHPLYGGNMHNAVCEAIDRAYREKGYTTLRFNFRGVGKSGGTFGGGAGEQEDLRAAVAYLRELEGGPADLAGYSFGTYVNTAAVLQGLTIARMIMVSPPLSVMEFGRPAPLPSLACVVTGGSDDIAPPALIGPLVPLWNPEAQFRVVEGADHFYSYRITELEELLVSLI